METPSHTDDQLLLTSWLAVIGMLTMYWSPVERHIDQCVHLLHIGKSGNSRKPTRLGSKLEFVEKNIPAGVIAPKDMEGLLKLTKTTVQIRDVCVHGVLNAYDEHRIEIGKIDSRSEKHLIEVFTIDRARLEKSATALSSLQAQWGAISSALLKQANARVET